MPSNEELCRKIQAGENANMNFGLLYLQNTALIKKVALRYAGVEELEDLIQESYFGLLKAAQLYDESLGFKFTSYAPYWIRNVIESYLENNSLIRLPRHRRQRMQKYRKIINQFALEFNREPTPAELAAALEITKEQAEQVKADALSFQRFASIDAPVASLEDESVTLADMIADPADDMAEVEEKIQAEQLARVLWAVVDSLGESQSAVIRARYQDGKTVKQVSQELNYTRSKVQNLQEKAIRTLRSTKIRRKLEPYYDDIPAIAMRGSLTGFQSTWTSSTERAVLIAEARRDAVDRLQAQRA